MAYMIVYPEGWESCDTYSIVGADNVYVSRMTHALTDIDRARRCSGSAARATRGDEQEYRNTDS
eukprot:4423443-Pleurochrysis_carterae.AAC.1